MKVNKNMQLKIKLTNNKFSLRFETHNVKNLPKGGLGHKPAHRRFGAIGIGGIVY